MNHFGKISPTPQPHVNSSSSSIHQLVFQAPLATTVTRSASAPRQTNCATLCPDRATALQVFKAPDVTKVSQKGLHLSHLTLNLQLKSWLCVQSVVRVGTVQTANGSAGVTTEGSASLPPGPASALRGSSEHAATSVSKTDAVLDK